MKRSRLHLLQILTHVGAWIPLAVLIYDYYNDNLTVNPIQALQQRTGQIAIVLLILSLACTPVNTLFRYPPVLKVRRALGLYAYMYAAIHLLIFTGLDFGFDVPMIVDEVLKKRFILIGMTAFLLLTVLAFTSFDWWMKRMGKKWKQLHRLVYAANLLVVLHFAFAVKGDIFRLQGNIIWPLAAAAFVTLLLVLRIRAIRRRLSAQNPFRLQLSRQASVDVSRKKQRPEG
jgi:sulfoxide reductase heme-binding subunit YedZ